jgi:hypothetical protein
VSVGPVAISPQNLGLAIGFGLGVPVVAIIVLVFVAVHCCKKRMKIRKEGSLPRCECCCGLISEPKCCFPDCKMPNLDFEMNIDFPSRRIECRNRQFRSWKTFLEFQTTDFGATPELKLKGADENVKLALKLLKKFPDRRGIKKLIKLAVDGNKPAQEALFTYFKPFFTRKFILKDLGLRPVAEFAALGDGLLPTLGKKDFELGDVDGHFPFKVGKINGLDALFYDIDVDAFETGLVHLNLIAALSLSSDSILPTMGLAEVKKAKLMGCKGVKFGQLRDLYFDSDLVTYLSIAKKLNMAITCATGLRAFHFNGVIHGNINSTNVFMDEASLNFGENFEVEAPELFEEAPVTFYLGSLSVGGMKNIDKDLSISLGIYPYLAPELFGKIKEGISHDDWKKPADIYAFGYLLWEAYHEEIAYRRDFEEDEDPTDYDKKEKVEFNEETTKEQSERATKEKKKDTEDDEDRTPLPISSNCPWKDIIIACWSPDPEDRPTIDDLITELENLNQSLRRVVKCCW